jgi:hypothetical protein
MTNAAYQMTPEANMMFLYLGSITQGGDVDAMLSWTNPTPPGDVVVTPVTPAGKGAVFGLSLSLAAGVLAILSFIF